MPGTATGEFILSDEGVKYYRAYRVILELLARFAYASIREFMYAGPLTLRSAIRRLTYLEEAGLIQTFDSQTFPKSFYCLTPRGRKAVKNFAISDELSPFVPWHYQLVSQQHHRSIIKVYLGLQKLLGDRFLGWTTEQRLKAEGGANREKRILDGELFLNVEKTRLKSGEGGEMTPLGEPALKKWRCGVEVELSLKSPERYKDQFRDLVPQVYDSWGKVQHYPMIVFFYTTPTIHDALAKQLKSGLHNFGNCVFYLAQLDEFLERLGEAPVEKFIGAQSKIMTASVIGEARTVTK